MFSNVSCFWIAFQYKTFLSGNSTKPAVLAGKTNDKNFCLSCLKGILGFMGRMFTASTCFFVRERV